jgi:hypothetical protein
VCNVLTGTNRALIGLGIGIGAAGIGGAIAHALSKRDDAARARAAYDPGPVHSAKPGEADGPADLAVAWWPQDLQIEQDGTDATLRFQSTVANLGGEAIDVRAGDRVEYTVQRTDANRTPGTVVGRGSAPLDRADVQPFPVPEGEEIGHAIQTFGVDLKQIDSLAPQTAAIVGAQQATQAIHITDASAGTYVLTQRIVHGDGTTEASSFNDARLTELILDGEGGMLHASSRYGG